MMVLGFLTGSPFSSIALQPSHEDWELYWYNNHTKPMQKMMKKNVAYLFFCSNMNEERTYCSHFVMRGFIRNQLQKSQRLPPGQSLGKHQMGLAGVFRSSPCGLPHFPFHIKHLL
ncbi:MAG TPA: hypothetical protein VLM80_04640 [Anaerolineales bacterium]|nr:hypothetical protein [Anaerolineales bacterium]